MSCARGLRCFTRVARQLHSYPAALLLWAAVLNAQVAHQNPVPSTSDDFDISRGTDLLGFSEGTYIGGAVSVLSTREDLDLVPIFAAGGPSAGVLEHASFLEMAEELLTGVRGAQAEEGIDAVYFSMHGAMATFEEHDPEGYLLEQLRVSTVDYVD